MKSTHGDLVVGYLKHFETKSENDRWAFAEVTEICQRDASTGMDLAVALVEACVSDAQLAYVAAGPIEDLLCGDANVYLLVDAACKKSQKFLRAVHLTYMDESDESFPRWKALLSKNPLEN